MSAFFVANRTYCTKAYTVHVLVLIICFIQHLLSYNHFVVRLVCLNRNFHSLSLLMRLYVLFNVCVYIRPLLVFGV